MKKTLSQLCSIGKASGLPVESAQAYVEKFCCNDLGLDERGNLGFGCGGARRSR